MDTKARITEYWKRTLAQDAVAMRQYFSKEARINWHNSNESFTLEEYIRANCEYPNTWDGVMERYHSIDNLIITVLHVFTKDHSLSFHVTSFIELDEHQQIATIDEYWGDDGEAPQWRKELHIGNEIKNVSCK